MRGFAINSAARNRAGLMFLAGFAVLAAGALVYSLERPQDSVLFLPAILSLHDGNAIFPPLIGGPLPTFLHAAAFTCMTAALLGPGPRHAAQAAAIWATINILFECAQHPMLALIPGTFDPLDLLAAPLGAAAAHALIRKFRHEQRPLQ